MMSPKQLATVGENSYKVISKILVYGSASKHKIRTESFKNLTKTKFLYLFLKVGCKDLI